ncbi:creatininase family protein [Halomarina halobia]|uniref:Creatininase family protein n=1 Tax=Halomarina halobia TaxID=3033386 RepID=A0ABD6AEW4_9EURY|nr:creatininase family protein [Halomarina sp. PSR21]
MQDLTWQDVDQYIEDHDSPVVLVPIGSTEQHGPHLPLGVDAYQALDLAEGIAETANVLTTPPIWFGDAAHHLGFPGTISLSTETVVALLTDVYDSLALHGFENIITINGHRVANLPAIETATKQATEAHPESHFAIVDPLRIGVQVHERLRDGGAEDGMHGGEFETSFMQAKHPELVKEKAFVRETHKGFSRFHSNNLIDLDDTVLSPSTRRRPEEGYLGHVGDPTKASPKKGEQIYDTVVENTVTYIEELLASQEG